MATLGGKPLAVAPISWQIAAGTTPVTRQVVLDKADAEALMRDGRAADLVFGDVTVKGLWPLRIRAHSNPSLAILTVGDRRWKWSRKLVVGDYNIRRRAGNKRAVQQAGERVQYQQLAEQERYAAYSLKPDGGAYQALEIVEDLLAQVGDKIDQVDSRGLPAALVEGVSIAATGDTAIAQALAQIPGAKIYLDLDDKLHFYVRTDGRHTATIAAIGEPLVGPPLLRDTIRGPTRPRSIRVHFTSEVEVSLEIDGTRTRTPDQIFLLDNVAPVPDLRLLLPSGEVVWHGSWVDIDTLLEAWQNDPRPSQPFELTDANIRKALFVPGALQAFLMGTSRPDPIAAARIATVLSHYRRTWRMQRELLERIVSWRPYRVGIVDYATQLPARAQVWGQYVLLYSEWGRVFDGDTTGSIAGNFSTDFEDSDAGELAAPLQVSAVEPDAGILRLTPRRDLLGHTRDVLLGRAVARDGGGSTLAHLDCTALRGHGAGGTLEDLVLAEGYRAEVIVTAVPAIPSSRDRFWVEEVRPEHLSRLSVGESKGPPLDVLVPVNPAKTAWFPWVASDGDYIRNSWYTREASHYGSPANLEQLRALAEAIALQIYETQLDQPVGQLTGNMTPGAVPAGRIEAVVHGLSADGVRRTSVALVEAPRPIDPLQWLPPQLQEQFRGLLPQETLS